MAIKPKKKICKSCGKEKYIWADGKCKMCSSSNSSFPSLKGTALKSSGYINPISKKTSKKKKERAKRREPYFEYHIEKCYKSEESGRVIPEPTRANICHLFDKGRHPSLEANLDNFVYLTFEEHDKFDKLLFALDFQTIEKEFKNSWGIACERYKKLLPLCKENTKFYRNIKRYINGRY